MSSMNLLLAAVAASSLLASAPAWAGPQDYKFELAEPPSMAGKATVLKIRLVHTPDGKAVADAVIIRSRLDMSPGGMASMTAPVRAMPASGGTYSFQAETNMAGEWALHLSAKVQGEPATVTGSVTFKASK